MQKPAPVYTLDFVLHPERDAAFRHFENASANPFQPNPPDFPRVNVWWLGEAALLTYWDPADAIPIFESAGFECEFITASGTDCYVASQADFVVVAFRGTQPDEWKDIVADANILLSPWPTGMVHLGFKRAFDALRPQLDAILRAWPQVERCGSAGTASVQRSPRWRLTTTRDAWRVHVGVAQDRQSRICARVRCEAVRQELPVCQQPRCSDTRSAADRIPARRSQALCRPRRIRVQRRAGDPSFLHQPDWQTGKTARNARRSGQWHAEVGACVPARSHAQGVRHLDVERL